jgi:hypothetical protein
VLSIVFYINMYAGCYSTSVTTMLSTHPLGASEVYTTSDAAKSIADSLKLMLAGYSLSIRYKRIMKKF